MTSQATFLVGSIILLVSFFFFCRLLSFFRQRVLLGTTQFFKSPRRWWVFSVFCDDVFHQAVSLSILGAK